MLLPQPDHVADNMRPRPGESAPAAAVQRKIIHIDMDAFYA
jgi:hypothetical protein